MFSCLLGHSGPKYVAARKDTWAKPFTTNGLSGIPFHDSITLLKLQTQENELRHLKICFPCRLQYFAFCYSDFLDPLRIAKGDRASKPQTLVLVCIAASRSKQVYVDHFLCIAFQLWGTWTSLVQSAGLGWGPKGLHVKKDIVCLFCPLQVYFVTWLGDHAMSCRNCHNRVIDSARSIQQADGMRLENRYRLTMGALRSGLQSIKVLVESTVLPAITHQSTLRMFRAFQYQWLEKSSGLHFMIWNLAYGPESQLEMLPMPITMWLTEELSVLSRQKLFFPSCLTHVQVIRFTDYHAVSLDYISPSYFRRIILCIFCVVDFNNKFWPIFCVIWRNFTLLLWAKKNKGNFRTIASNHCQGVL